MGWHMTPDELESLPASYVLELLTYIEIVDERREKDRDRRKAEMERNKANGR